jgi:hypothetical protein
MMQPLPTRCPLCSGAVHVERVKCESCAAAVEGEFVLDWVGALSPEQLRFVGVFLACRGKIKDVEAALGLSYPTVVSRLDDVVAAMGVDGRALPAGSSPRLDVLEELSKGAISVDEAERRLKSGR